MTTARSIPFAAIFLGFLAVLTPLHALPVRFLAWDEAIAARKIGFVNGTEIAELQALHPHRRTKAVTWTAGEIPPALVALDRKAEDGKPVTIPLKFSAGLKSPLVVILPDPKHATGLRGFVMEDAAGSFAWGTLRFINATGKEILVRQDKEVKALPETWKTVDIKPGGSRRNIAIQMASRTDLNTVLYSSVWEHDPDVRKLIIVVPGTSTDGGALDLKIIPEDRRSIAVAVESPSAAQVP
jgi:hypothetical protein